jgi:hypothetical protein
MTSVSPSIRWVKVAFAVSAIVFVLHAVVFFTRTAPNFVHSDSATEVLLTALVLDAKSPLVPNFYYVNGDLWIVGAHWFAWPFVLLFGISPTSLFATNAFSLAGELVALTWGFHRLSGSLLRAAFASVVVLFSWSTLHLHFAYVEMTYGFIATFHFLVFVLYARLLTPRPPEEAPRKLRRDAAAALALFFLFAVQNPTRAVAFELVPVLVGCLWRWQDSSQRWRKRVATFTVAAWLLAFLVHRLVLRALVTPAQQAGMGFGFRGLGGIARNLHVLFKGLIAVTEPRDDLPGSVILGLVLLVGAFAWVLMHTMRARAYEPMRFVCVVVLAELALVLGLLVIGDMLSDEKSTRYLMPALLPMFGLGCLVATRTVAEATSSDTRARLSLAWLCLLPIDASIAASRRLFGAREVFSEVDPATQQKVADELVRRHLVHGFATYWNANALTLLSNGAAKTCAVAFRDGVIPRKWLVGTDCFDATRLPPSIYFIARAEEREVASRAFEKTLPPPVDRFTVDQFEVSVFRTSECSLSWLELPRARLP